MALIEVEGQKISNYDSIISNGSNAVRFLIWVEYEVKGNKVVVTHKSFSLDPWDAKNNHILGRSEDWFYYAQTPSAAKRMFNKWAKKYAPNLEGKYDTEYFQGQLQNRICEAQHSLDKESFQDRAKSFKSELKVLMKKYGIGIEGYIYGSEYERAYGSIDIYDATRESHDSNFEDELLELEDGETVQLNIA